MAHRILVVVDMQNDFVSGSLGSAEAQAIVPAVLDKVRSFDGTVLFTKDTHTTEYLSTQEGRHLPVEHCIEGTDGWQLIEPLQALQKDLNARVYCKPAFGSVQLAHELAALHRAHPIDSIELVGLCTDICVVSNALLLKACLPEVPMCVDAACCAGVTPDSHKAALQTMASCQVEILNA